MKNNHPLSLLTSFRLLVVLMIMSSPSISWAALSAFATMTGETQGAILGDSTQAGHEGQIEVFSFGYNINRTYDPATGVPGAKQHRPIRILKNIDRSSPILFKVMVSNEKLTQVTIRFYEPGPGGIEVQYYTVELTNAKIVSIMPSSSSVGDSLPLPGREVISLVFEQITVTSETGGTQGQDSWQINPAP
jgi:type VI secretion system secreted protein Hcp